MHLTGMVAPQQARALLTLIQQKGTKVRLSKSAQTQDPKDDYLLELAISGEADVLVTLDGKDLLVVGRVGNTRILNTALFLRSLGLAAPKKKQPNT
jgi:predicted nucleic acid-binding protein